MDIAMSFAEPPLRIHLNLVFQIQRVSVLRGIGIRLHDCAMCQYLYKVLYPPRATGCFLLQV